MKQLLILLMTWFLAFPASAQHYEAQWKKVNAAISDDQPKTVVLEAHRIYQMAERDGSMPDMLKAYLTWMRYRDEISPDSLEVDMKQLRHWQETCQDEVDKAVLSLVLAVNASNPEERYNYYCQTLGLNLPAEEKIFSSLEKRKTSEYLPLVSLQDGSAVFEHDMLSFLRQMAVQSMPWTIQRRLKEPLYRRDEQYYYSQGNLLAAYRVASEGMNNDAGIYHSLSDMKERYGSLADFQIDEACSKSTYHHEKERIEELKALIAKYPHHNQVGRLQAQLQDCMRPSLSVQQKGDLLYPNTPVPISLSMYNIQQVEARWYQLPDALAKSLTYQEMDSQQRRKAARLVKTEKLTFEAQEYLHADTTLLLQTPEQTGYYLLEFKPLACGEYPVDKVQTEADFICITRLMSVVVPMSEHQWEVWAIDQQTGHSVPRVKVTWYTQKSRGYQLAGEVTTDDKGVATIVSNHRNFQVQLAKDQDVTFLTNTYRGFHEIHSNERTVESARLFTDRSLYRPGQKVDFSLLAYAQQKDNTFVLSDKEFTIRLRGPRSSKDLGTVTLKTDELGVAVGSFELPKDLLSGSYTLSTSRASCSIQVEEYKRPTFEVEWLPVEGSYQLGDTITVKGVAKQYSGAPLQDAQVVLTATYKKMSWWRMVNQEVSQPQDTIQTDDQGQFAYRLVLQIPSDIDAEGGMGMFHHFSVNAIVTSLGGESHEATQQVTLSEQPFSMSLTYQAKECKEQLSTWKVNLYNASFTPLEENVKVSIREKDTKKEVWTDQWKSGESRVLSALRSIKSGRYIVTLSFDSKTMDYDLTLFSMDDKQPVEDTPLWMHTLSTEMDAQHPVEVQLGTSLQEGFIVLHLYNGQNCLLTKTYSLSNQLEKLILPYQAEYGDGVLLQTWLVRDGQIYQKSLSFTRTCPDKQLKVEWTSFRDCLQPGDSETWTLHILNPDGQPVKTNLMATLYDASLDALYAHHWNFGLSFNRPVPSASMSYAQYRFAGYLSFPDLKNYRWEDELYDSWADDIELSYGRAQLFMGRGRVMYSRAANVLAAAPDAVMSAKMVANVEMEESGAVEDAIEEAPSEETSEIPTMEMRSDFSETAFFYPQLRTDSKGNVNVQFTLPQSLTKWHMIGFAHTQDMSYALLDKSLQARKLVMVSPNLPRFLRVGDQASLIATVQNLSDAKVSGTLYVELSDSTLEHIIYKDQQMVTMEANSSQSVTFSYLVPDLGPSVICRFYVKTEDYSDGEQHLLPILSDKTWLTESRAIYLNDSQQTIDLSAMMNGGKLWNEHSSMAVETIHNPLWVVLETLGDLRAPYQENAVDLAVTYYAASLGHMLQVKQPLLAEQQAFKVDTLQSTQWLKQLENLQQADGGFSWYKGMLSSAYITRLVVENFMRLRLLGVPHLDGNRYEQLVGKALRFLDEAAIETYHDMQKWEKQNKTKLAPGDQILHYLYIYSIQPHALSAEGKKALDYFTQRLSLWKGESLYDKALACIVCARMNKKNLAEKHLQSLLEYTVYTDELGRYYDSRRSMVSWRNYRIPVQTLLLEAIYTMHPAQLKVAPDQPALSTETVRRQLCQWLLNQRRTQQWTNSSTIMDVLYALLLSPASDLKVTQADKVYTKEEVQATETAEMPKSWTVQREEQTDSPMSWVSVSMKSYVPLDQVEQDAKHSGLHIEQTYLLPVVKEGEVHYQPVKTSALSVGQKVVLHLKISADRDFDFVEVHAARPACLEPVHQLSGYAWQGGLGYYGVQKDTENQYFIDRLAKGSYEIDVEFYVTHEGAYLSGLTTIQGSYCPEFSDHAATIRLSVQPQK